MSAMRGPDVPHGHPLMRVKYHVTSRLRAMVYDHSDCWGLHNADRMEHYDFEQLIGVLKSFNPITLSGGEKHFLRHLYEAFFEVADHKVWNGHGEDIIIELRRIV